MLTYTVTFWQMKNTTAVLNISSGYFFHIKDVNRSGKYLTESFKMFPEQLRQKLSHKDDHFTPPFNVIFTVN